VLRLSVAILGALAATAAAPTRAPVLVELFTSEGCSSCPPADRVLEALDAQAIVLSEHVDYWDHQGWRDPWSSRASTLRQEAYARQLGKQGPYTPQMVIDGRVEFNGSDGRRALDEIANARAREKAEIHLTRSESGVEIAIDAAPHAGKVYMATAQESAESQVKGGENNGRRLRHVSILRSLKRVGVVKKGAGFRGTAEVPADAGRVIVFLQDGDAGAVYGAAVVEFRPQMNADGRR
jgi:hypothetical protein